MRILLSIGCNKYDNISSLKTAEKDACDIYRALVDPNVGDYNPELSKLLLSPSIDDLRNATQSTIFRKRQIDTFTFFFAGHGCVRSDSFYMAVQDTDLSALSFTAFSLSSLFLAVNEVRPKQTNIIIDACESGGVISDLGLLLRSELIGNLDTHGVTLVATSAANQESIESEQGGIGTQLLLECINGDEFIHDSQPTMDLVEIGRNISTRLREISDQSPVVWGLNLYGPPRFCRNPFYHTDVTKPLRQVIQSWTDAEQERSGKSYELLWDAYRGTSSDWEPRRFHNNLKFAVEPIADGQKIADFVSRLSVPFLERSEASADAFRPAEVAAAMAATMLSYSNEKPGRAVMKTFCHQCSMLSLKACKELNHSLKINEFSLLSSKSIGLGDLYVLPIRIAKVLGWAAATPILMDDCHSNRNDAIEIFGNLLNFILDKYELSVQALSDAQAPYWAITITSAIRFGLREQAEKLSGLLYHSLLEHYGKVARADLEPEYIIDFLLCRRIRNYSKALNIIEYPNQTISVLFRSAHALDLEDVFDFDLWELDGTTFMAFICHDFRQFGNEVIGSGDNAVWTIGHDVFRLREFVESWPAGHSELEDDVQAGALAASLIYPDRVPWFVFDHVEAE